MIFSWTDPYFGWLLPDGAAAGAAELIAGLAISGSWSGPRRNPARFSAAVAIDCICTHA